MTSTAIISLPLSTAIESAKQQQVRLDFFSQRFAWDSAAGANKQQICGTCAIGGAITVACPDFMAGRKWENLTFDDIEIMDAEEMLPELSRKVPVALIPADVRRTFEFAAHLDMRDVYRTEGISIGSIIMCLNDDACWTRQKIAQWLRTIGF